MCGVVLLSIGDQVRSGAYEVHSRFQRVVNFVGRGELISLVSEEVGAGPLNVVIGGPGCEEVIRSASKLRIDAEEVLVGDRRFSLSNVERYRSELVFGDWDKSRLLRNLALFEELLVKDAAATSMAFLLEERIPGRCESAMESALRDRMRRGVQEVFEGDLLEGIELLKGCGWGLTPSGDDFIAGLLVGMELLQKLYEVDFSRTMDAVYEAALGENLLSNRLLALARRGLLFEKLKKLVEVLVQGETEEVAAASREVFAVGASSGADLSTGFLMMVREQEARFSRWSWRAVAQGA